MTGRVYSIAIDAVPVSAAQDIFYVAASSTVPFELHSIQLGQKTLTTWEAKEVTLRRLTTSVVAGSGGASFTPVPHMPGDAAATVTARRNDTALATATTNLIIQGLTWEFLNGFYWSPAGEDDRIRIAPSSALVLRLGTAPSASMTVSGAMVISELV